MTDEDFEIGGCGCLAILLLVALTIGICVWKYHNPTPPKRHVQVEVCRMTC